MPYRGRYPAGSLVHNGVWYYSTYCLGPHGQFNHNGFIWNWPNMGPVPGFQISYDYGKTWIESPLSPEEPLFPEPKKMFAPVKMGAPHFVDFGQNMEHSPDGKAYLLSMGAEQEDSKPRSCVDLASEGKAYKIREECTGEKIVNEFIDGEIEENFAHANLSWITADQIYLSRVVPSPETINDEKAYEYFAGLDQKGHPIWSNDFNEIEPLIEWNNNKTLNT